MEQSDLLDSEQLVEETAADNKENGNFAILLPSIILDRFSYYGFRSIMLVYAMDHFQLSATTALSQYLFFTALIYIMCVPGGILGDFVIKSKHSLIIGSLITAVGAGLCALPIIGAFYAGCILIILGSGLYRPNIISYIARTTGNDLRLLGQRYLSMYLMINVGAFLGGLFLVLIADTFGYHFGFSAVALSWLLSAILLYTVNGKSRNHKKPAIHSRILTYKSASGATLLLMIIPVVATVIYWISYEHFYPRYLVSTFDLLQIFEPGSVIKFLMTWLGPLIIFPIAVIMLLVFRKVWFHPLQKVGIGMSLMAITWGLLFVFPESMNTDTAITMYVIFSIIVGISELFITPAMFTLFAAMTKRKILGTITGIYFLIVGIGNSFASELMGYFDPHSDRFFIPWICFGLGAALFILPYFIKKKLIDQIDQIDEIDKIDKIDKNI
ncbi:MAG: POT family proton-dependent oligopeptide transporter [Flavobacteriaceae bacterium]|jgi:POT family proton-dependent oligopeptide transporter